MRATVPAAPPWLPSLLLFLAGGALLVAAAVPGSEWTIGVSRDEPIATIQVNGPGTFILGLEDNAGPVVDLPIEIRRIESDDDRVDPATVTVEDILAGDGVRTVETWTRFTRSRGVLDFEASAEEGGYYVFWPDFHETAAETLTLRFKFEQEP